MTQTTEYLETVKEQIVFLLANEILTTRQMEERLTLSYPTIRRAVVSLEEEKRVIKFDKRARNARYTLAPTGQEPHVRIPSITFKGRTINLSNVYLGQGIEDLAQGSADAILRAWTTIATSARRINEGVPSTVLTKKLNRQKVLLAEARMNLEQLVFIINQMLDNDKLWDMESLAKFVEDDDWDMFLPHLNEMYQHYYGVDD